MKIIKFIKKLFGGKKRKKTTKIYSICQHKNCKAMYYRTTKGKEEKICDICLDCGEIFKFYKKK